ncbi:ABC transporter permease [Mucilaginibacter sp.]|uniref:ABC transporter permease n=1 Tax=Mucilaginibacter sp. TaxID=1882438 RepID=UPI00284B709D|nr:ABC transporter permease [Mucilaginibacter sp.]MDR3695242.1 ABC transporter permease [Mucilaginibacter sp.]
MIKIHFKIAWRILMRQKTFSLVNILGLAIGMAACLLIVQYISFERSYDNFHVNANRIYRIKHQNYSQGNLIENLPRTYSAVGPALKSQFPEVQEMTRIVKMTGLTTARQPNGSLVAFNEKSIYVADPSFLRLFSFPMKEGSPGALQNPNTVVITAATAKKYFPNQEAIGKTINLQEQNSGTNITATVTGICKNVPANSQLQFDFVFSGDQKAGNWSYPDSYTYIQLSPNTNPKAFEAKLSAFLKSSISLISKTNNNSNTQGKSDLNNISLTLQPLRDIHLYSNLTDEISPGGNGSMVWYLGIIAALILIIAYVNYLNLTTAKVMERAKEVGVRKVLGSQRAQLIKQFLFESFLLNIISLATAAFIVSLAMPWFSKLCGVDLNFDLWKNLSFLAAFITILAAGVLLSAIYPALILSSYKPVQVLKGKFMNSAQRITLRKALVVFQFAATITFMIGTLVVYRQVNYMKNQNKGMNMKQTLIVVAPQNVRATDLDNLKYRAKDSTFQTELSLNPQVQSITSSSSIPGQIIDYIMAYTSHAQMAGEKSLRLSTFEIGSKFIDQFGIKLVAGDKFTADSWNRKTPAMMLNEAAVTSLGFKNAKEAIGKLVETKNGRGRVFQNEIVGVIQNFHQMSLKDDFTPIVFRLSDPGSITHYELKLKSSNIPQAIAQVEKTYKRTYPESAFEYFFLDDFFNQQYNAEQHFGQVFTLFSGFAVFVACLGLFGLTLTTITQRIKEIGIRKVLGASVANILLLISKDFIGLIATAAIIAFPLAYWGSNQWLQGYKFRIHFDAWYFILPVLAAFLLTAITISYQSIRAAIANPVRSLKTE